MTNFSLGSKEELPAHADDVNCYPDIISGLFSDKADRYFEFYISKILILSVITLNAQYG